MSRKIQITIILVCCVVMAAMIAPKVKQMLQPKTPATPEVEDDEYVDIDEILKEDPETLVEHEPEFYVTQPEAKDYNGEVDGVPANLQGYIDSGWLPELDSIIPGMTLEYVDKVETQYANEDIWAIIHYKNTDTATTVYSDSNAGIYAADTCNYYGSDYPMVYFNNGVPNNSEQLYEIYIEECSEFWDYCVSDYKEGDPTCTFKDVETGEELTFNVGE